MQRDVRARLPVAARARTDTFGERTASAQPAAVFDMRSTRRLSVQHEPRAPEAGVGDRHGRDQRARVGMARRADDLGCTGLLDDDAEIHDRNALGQSARVHSSRHGFGAASPYAGDREGRIGNAEHATQDAIHPVVIRRPDSDRKALCVNPGFTLRFDGWTAEESRPLLDYLYQHATRPELTSRFHWRPGAVAFSDNRASWHYALNDYAGQRRLMHRITLEGVALSPPADGRVDRRATS